MPQKPRPRRVQVKLSDEEYSQLAASAAMLGTTKAAIVRDALTKTSSDGPRPVPGEPSRNEALELLAAAARDGSVTAATALARELRIEPVKPPPTVVGTVKLRDLPSDALRVVK